jgi:hypothetical protein
MRPDTMPATLGGQVVGRERGLMLHFRRSATAVVLFALLLAAAPTPAAARPWTVGMEEALGGVQWRVITWMIKVFNPRPTLTNVTGNEGARVIP